MLVCATAALLSWCHRAPAPLVVCADPNNLPFSNRAGEGFENRLARRIGADLHRPVRFVWWAQRRGFVRNTVGEGSCDLWPGVASGFERLATTRPYYRSSYVFVSRSDRPFDGLTLDDPRLRKARIGVQLVGDDGSNTPPAHAIARRGLRDNVRGFMLYGNYRNPNPPSEIVNAVSMGQIDVGLVWGPLAGYFAQRSPARLRLTPIEPWLDNNQWPMAYDISVGVRRDDPALLHDVGQALERDKDWIGKLLRSYGVPEA